METRERNVKPSLWAAFEELASFPLIADDKIVTNNDRNRKLHNI